MKKVLIITLFAVLLLVSACAVETDNYAQQELDEPDIEFEEDFFEEDFLEDEDIELEEVI